MKNFVFIAKVLIPLWNILLTLFDCIYCSYANMTDPLDFCFVWFLSLELLQWNNLLEGRCFWLWYVRLASTPSQWCSCEALQRSPAVEQASRKVDAWEMRAIIMDPGCWAVLPYFRIGLSFSLSCKTFPSLGI